MTEQQVTLSDVRTLVQSAGLVSSADLGRRWGVSKAHAHRLVGMAGFPDPVTTVNDHPVWFWVEAESWRKKFWNRDRLPRNEEWNRSIESSAQADTTGRRRRVLDALSEIGGLATATELVRVIGLSAVRVHQMTHRDDFPAPVAMVGTRPVWVVDDVRDWYADYSRRVAHLGSKTGPKARGARKSKEKAA